jgi:hypothetical protein
MRAVKTPKQLVAAYKKAGSLRGIRRETGQTWHSIKTLYDVAVVEGLIDKLSRAGHPSRENAKDANLSTTNVTGRVKPKQARDVSRGKKKGVRRYIFTSAQNNTKVWEPFWQNILALAEHYDAEIHVSRFTYVKHGLGAAGDKAQMVKRSQVMGDRGWWWDPCLEPYYSDVALKIAPDLIWCGEMNILPTAAHPLSGFASYTGAASGIFPHTKIALESIPTRKMDPAKMNYATGACTRQNYIQRAAGLKAQFHHCYGALLVEVDENGDWFARQLNADSKATICDLGLIVASGVVSEGNDVEAVNWGDIHVQQVDPVQTELCWGKDSIIDTLRPRHQFAHDLLDFLMRNHHGRDYHSRMKAYVEGLTVKEEIEGCFEFVDSVMSRPWCTTVVVPSNHDDAATRWLREVDFRHDPENALFYLECQTAMTVAILARDREFSLMRYFQERFGTAPVEMLLDDSSFLLHGIEFGMHGHMGPNGSRGGIKGFARMGRKANIGHSHTAGICDGLYQAGTASMLDLGYNKGPSSWSQSHIITYGNGKRAIITCRNGKWHA